MVKRLYNSETGCCKRFNPKPWDNKKINFKNTLFIKDRVRSIFHIPINFGKVMVRDMEKIASSKALAKNPILLTDENSLWGADIYIAVSKKVNGFEIVKIPGSFLSKVFEGPYRDIGKWIKEMNEYLTKKGKKAEKLYFFYTTCPKCAKVYGKNYVVLLAKIK
jgi:hypothetical protein